MRGPDARASKMSARTLSGYYITALLIIGGLTIISHLAIATVLHQNQGAAAVINMSGRQRMLSQRIAGLAAQYRLGDASARAALLESLDEFTDNETALAARALGDGGGGGSTRQLRAMYRPEFRAEMAAFIADARQVAALPPNAPEGVAPLHALFAESRAPLLDQLNAIVSVHQGESERVLAELELLQFIILVAVMGTLAAEAVMIFQPMIRRIEVFTTEIVRLATIDPLTGLPNRRGFMEGCGRELERARRYGGTLSVLMLDADHFKRINDEYGHAGGDLALQHLAETLLGTLRATDVAGRMGGEEFAVLLPETDIAGARQLAQRIRMNIAAAPLMMGHAPAALTVSVGVAPVPIGKSPGTGPIELALKEADEALYRAKAEGRNRVVMAAAEILDETGIVKI
jgi:diguanylate cyclase (GGDEF)-like protein